jgi:ureidoglycolate hydrolase
MENNSLTATQFIKNHEGLWHMLGFTWNKLNKFHVSIYDTHGQEVHWICRNKQWTLKQSFMKGE